MNVTELARKLKITTVELLDALPQLGFDIGKRAIKIDDRVAHKIIGSWSELKQRWKKIKVEAEESAVVGDEKIEERKKIVKIPETITVREFAAAADISVSKVLGELMKNGIFVSMNEKIDYDTAAIIGDDLNFEVEVDKQSGEGLIEKEDKIKESIGSGAGARERPPVIVVMGHVDHGKTKLLDAIRKTNVADKESGGITQHIGAYQIEYKRKLITFIDTPGHEVFTAMRGRGAKVADVAILVVAADDSVKPQTVEAYRIIEQAGLPFVVAINKIDKPEADIEKTKSDLSNKLKIIPREWGGKTDCVPVSAKEGKNIEDVLEAILSAVEAGREKIIANPDSKALGTVIESHIDRGEGPVSTILVQNGTLRTGDVICVNNEPFGKVRLMKNHEGNRVEEAAPSSPIRAVGLKAALNIGDIIEAVGEDHRIRLKKRKKSPIYSFNEVAGRKSEEIKKINVVIKSDVFGSLEAIEEALEKISGREIKVKIVSKGLGNVTAGDVYHALASKATIISFNVEVPATVELLAKDKGIEVKSYKIIYELVDYIKDKMQENLGTEIVRRDLGSVKVLAIFRTEADNQVVGGRVIKGKVEIGCRIDVFRGEEKIASGELSQLQSSRQNVKETEGGQECGIKFKGKPVIQIGDTLCIYKEEEVVKKLQ